MKQDDEEAVINGDGREAEAGVTLIEMLIVLAIIALVATLVAPRVVGYLGRAKSDIAATQLANVAAALDFYSLDVGVYPSEAEGLKALVDRPSGNVRWLGPYLKDEKGLVDPWGRPYLYELVAGNRSFIVSTLGADGQVGGDGEDADIAQK